jgi:GNAT superfamily N-acetyltransferase
MTPEQQAAAHDANFIAFFQAAAGVLKSSTSARYGSVPVVTTGVPAAFFNGAWLTEAADASDIEAAVGHLRATGLPFIIHVRADLRGREQMLKPFEIAPDGVLPCFAIGPGPIPDAPADLTMLRVGIGQWEDFLATTAEGFGMPRQMVDALYAPAVLDQPGVRAYVGYVDERPVAVAASYRTRSTIGIYNVATVEEARGHGYGTAATWQLLRDADPGWEVAILQASDMGRPVYERMGFQLVREFIEFVHRPAG